MDNYFDEKDYIEINKILNKVSKDLLKNDQFKNLLFQSLLKYMDNYYPEMIVDVIDITKIKLSVN
jgi:hypothetical protein